MRYTPCAAQDMIHTSSLLYAQCSTLEIDSHAYQQPFSCPQVMHELVDTVQQLDSNSSVRSIIITGKGKAFAAGADIKEMASLNQKQVRSWHDTTSVACVSTRTSWIAHAIAICNFNK